MKTIKKNKIIKKVIIKKSKLEKLKVVPDSFKNIYGNIELYLLKSKEVFPLVIDGFKHFGTCQDGFYYIKN